MKNNKLQMITWAFIIGCMMIGGFFGVYIIGKQTGEYRYDLVAPIAVGTIGGFLLFLLISKFKQKRSENVPDFDERSMLIIQKYLTIALYVILLGSGLALLITYAMDVPSIDTGLLIICLLGDYILVGLGAVVVKRL